MADPLPPIAHLVRLKRQRRARMGTTRAAPHDSAGAGQDRTLRCLINDEALLPLFEWAAREYAEAYAPYSLRFEVQPLPGRDDEESIREIDADLMMLPSTALQRAVHSDVVTPATGMLGDGEDRLAEVPSEVLGLASLQGELWAMPLMLDGPVLIADEDACRRRALEWAEWADVDDMLTAFETAVAAEAPGAGPRLFNLTFLLLLAITAGHEFPGIVEAPRMLERPETRVFLERLRRLAESPLVAIHRSDQWEAANEVELAVRHQPSWVFCRDPKARRGRRVLPIPGEGAGRIPMAAHCLCISARSPHPFEAWEWAACLGGAAFQGRLAEMAYNIPASANPEVRRTFGRAVGEENARALFEVTRRPSRIFGLRQEDVMRYLWEVFGNELFRFVTGRNTYARMIERTRAKTERYVRLREDESPAPEEEREAVVGVVGEA